MKLLKRGRRSDAGLRSCHTEMSGLWNFSVRVQSWPYNIESNLFLIRKIFENHQSDPVPIRSCKIINFYEAKVPLELFCLQKNVIGWRQSSCSSAFASWGKIDIAIWHSKIYQGSVYFASWSKSTAGVIFPLGEFYSFDCSNDKDDTEYTWISIKSL